VKDAVAAAALFLVLFSIYRANGREIGSYDSQPTKFAARELLRRGTLTLNYVVGGTPQLLERPAFVAARDGAYRSAYSPVPSIAAAVVTWPLTRLGVLDVTSPRSPSIIAVVAASALTAGAVVLSFLTARRLLPLRPALLVAAALGLGTGYWSTVSQTLWQHETAIFALSAAVYVFTAPVLTARHLIVVGLALGLAGASRAQTAPTALVLLGGAFARAGLPAVLAAAITGAAAAAMMFVNVRWFGSPLGGMALLEALHPSLHAVERSFDPRAGGFAGLLVSPSRGLLVYSPIALFALLGIRPLMDGPRSGPARTGDDMTRPLRVCAIAALAQYTLYACYAVWWGGHTFGPRYMLDVLPLLVPLAAGGLASAHLGRAARTLGGLLLAWSIAVAALGAFVFPHERWNTDPVDVDRNHERLWNWSDMQVLRAWRAGASPQNFSLYE
jgi:hypothetical protein